MSLSLFFFLFLSVSHSPSVSLPQLWVKVVNGDLQDSTRSDLYEYVVDFLSFCPNLDLVWKYADWALQKDQKVCTQRTV